VRLGTASLQNSGGQFIMTDKLNMKSIAKKNNISRAICDYLIYVEHNPKKALELASEATVIANYNDWWWNKDWANVIISWGYTEKPKNN